MRYFDYLDEARQSEIFFSTPKEFNKLAPREALSYSLGALLYIPAVRENMLGLLVEDKLKEVKAVVICLEDSAGNKGEEKAKDNLVTLLKKYDERLQNSDLKEEDLPLIFIRPKGYKHMTKLLPYIEKYLYILTGICIPKAKLEQLKKFIILNEQLKLKKINLYLMPIIETKDYVYFEKTNKALEKLALLIAKNKEQFLNIRMGMTDILGLYGLRRVKGFTIYDNLLFTSFAPKVTNIMNRKEIDIPVSGAVFEHFDFQDKVIRTTFIKEILLDKFNGIMGKTVIHPKQVNIVAALQVINYEDYLDAKSIISNYDGIYGTIKSYSGDRMNEINPHLNWAKKIIFLADIYGVFNKGVDYNELLKGE